MVHNVIDGDKLMRVSTGFQEYSLSSIRQASVDAESSGYDTFSSSETGHNPYLPLVLAAEHTEKIGLQTSIALAFARSPMDTAYLAWDLQNLSGGRLTLGLGSQVRGHIIRRFSMPWSAPAPRMREYILALRHIWNSWQNETKLDFAGDNYSFNLMSPFFNPGPIENPDINISIAAVNPNMLAVAGELCDGVILHSFNTPKYTKEVIIPSIQKGALRSGRSIEDIDVSGGGFIVTGSDEEELEQNKLKTKSQIAFYASTRSYSDVMKAHGWHDTHEKLYRMSVNGQWAEMGEHITDDMLDNFAVVGTHDEIVPKIRSTYGDFADSISFSMKNGDEMNDKETLRGIISGIQMD
jgi:probable F420-dependent oxidoreductase